jgi:hypothetical protein
MKKHVTYDDASPAPPLFVTHDEIIKFGGNNNTLNFVYDCTHDKVTATGTNQTINVGKTYDLEIVDHAQGLTLGFGIGIADITVKDFQNDLTGKFHFGYGPLTYTPDQNSVGITVTGYNGLFSVDFKGFHSVADLASKAVTFI